jgi:hypothetical protein
VLDPFWDSKPFISPAEFSRFCDAIVPLVRMPKRILTSDETLTAGIEVSNFGPSSLRQVSPQWSLHRGHVQVDSGELPKQDIPACQLVKVGQIQLPLRHVAAPAKLTLSVSVAGPMELRANSWDVWVYPTSVDTVVPARVSVTSELDETAIRQLSKGGKVLLLADPKTVKGDVQIGFSSIFWNTAWTDGQAPHTLGILCDPEHHLFDSFPTDFCSNWQWWDLISRSKPMVMDSMAPELRPIVQVVPDWFQPQRLGLVLEAKVGMGTLVVCSMDLKTDLDKRPVARQMLHSLLKYVNSDACDPKQDVALNDIKDLFREPPLLQRLGATAWADSQNSGHEATLAIDGNPNTMWHTSWEPSAAPHPHWIAIDLRQSLKVEGIRCVPRADMTNGRIASYEIHVSDDGKTWRKVAAGTWPNSATAQTVKFDNPQTTRYLKLVACREVMNRAWSSVAELDIIIADHD